MISPQYVDGLELRIKELEAERNEYRDLADKWRDDWTAAMDQCNAMAAHVESLKQYVRNEPEVDDLLDKLDKWCLDAPATSLVRLKAEAEQAFADWAEHDLTQDGLFINFEKLLERYRRQAEGGES